MRLSFLALVLALLAPLTALADGVEVVRVWPTWREPGSFKRISEFFTGKENTGSETVFRTQPDDRHGYYFLVRLKNEGPAIPAAKFVIHLILPDSPETKTYTFSQDLAKGSKVVNLGITGTDWPGKDINPVAWKFELHDASGQLVAGKGSFLWEMPAK